MEIKEKNINILGIDFDFNIVYEEAKRVFLEHTKELDEKSLSLVLQNDNLFGINYIPELFFSDILKKIILYPTYDYLSEEQGLANLENLSKTKLRECDLSFENALGETFLKNDNYITYFSESFIIELNYISRENLFSISILNNDIQNIANTILHHYSYYVKRISKETGNSIEITKKIIPNIKNINTNLNEELFAWLKNKEINTEYKGITLKDIKDKYNQSYFQSLFDMSVIMSNDSFVDVFMDNQFKRK